MYQLIDQINEIKTSYRNFYLELLENVNPCYIIEMGELVRCCFI